MKYIYIMSPKSPGIRKLALHKIGISDTPQRRTAEVEASLSQYGLNMPLRCWISVPLLSARLFEQRGHRIFSAFRSSRIPAGSDGYTEWFNIPNAVTALTFFYYLAPLLGLAGVRSEIALFIFLAPIPIDLMLAVIAAALAEWAAVALIVRLVTGFDIFALLAPAARLGANLVTYLTGLIG